MTALHEPLPERPVRGTVLGNNDKPKRVAQHVHGPSLAWIVPPVLLMADFGVTYWLDAEQALQAVSVSSLLCLMIVFAGAFWMHHAALQEECPGPFPLVQLLPETVVIVVSTSRILVHLALFCQLYQSNRRLLLSPIVMANVTVVLGLASILVVRTAVLTKIVWTRLRRHKDKPEDDEDLV